MADLSPKEAEAKIRRMMLAIVATIDAVDGGQQNNAVVNAALAGVIGLLARRMNDPDEWIAGMFDIVRKVQNGLLDRKRGIG